MKKLKIHEKQNAKFMEKHKIHEKNTKFMKKHTKFIKKTQNSWKKRGNVLDRGACEPRY